MYNSRRSNDAVQWYMSELTARVVAATGIPSDRYHLGKIVLRSLKDDPDFVLQIDGGTGQSETTGSVLERSVRCAIALRKLGLKRGDVMILMAPNHLDLAIPFYAALYLGVAVFPIDRTLGVNELQATFEGARPRIVFCQAERGDDVQTALNGIDSDAFIVTFNKGDFINFSDLSEKYGDKSPIEDFKPTDFDPEDTLIVLIATSGTTGLPKSAAVTHKNFAITGPYFWIRHSQFPNPTELMLIVSPLQWVTAILNFLLTAVMRFTRLQTSQPLTQEHSYELINKYKPSITIASPTFLSALISPTGSQKCDFTCFETYYIGGSAVSVELVQQLKELSPYAEVIKVMGMSEVVGPVFINEGTDPTFQSVGQPMGSLQYRLIDIETQEDIPEANRNGELWIKGPGIIKGYYRNPKATAEAFTEDGWFKTGDMFYRDEHYNFFFVDRIKLLLKYMNHQISPVELETAIKQHPGVLDVVVTGIPDPKRGDLAVACVVRRPGHDVGAEEIKDLVKDNFADSKRLRGGVIFLDAMPLTTTTKIDRRKLKEIAIKNKPNDEQ